MGLFGKDKGEEVVLGIEGMSCMHCVGKVEKGLKALDGVLSAEVNLEGKEAKVRYDPAKTSPDAVKRAVTESGYQVV